MAEEKEILLTDLLDHKGEVFNPETLPEKGEEQRSEPLYLVVNDHTDQCQYAHDIEVEKVFPTIEALLNHMTFEHGKLKSHQAIYVRLDEHARRMLEAKARGGILSHGPDSPSEAGD